MIRTVYKKIRFLYFILLGLFLTDSCLYIFGNTTVGLMSCSVYKFVHRAQAFNVLCGCFDRIFSTNDMNIKDHSRQYDGLASLKHDKKLPLGTIISYKKSINIKIRFVLFVVLHAKLLKIKSNKNTTGVFGSFLYFKLYKIIYE